MKRNVKLVKRPITVNNRMKQIRKEGAKGINKNLIRHQIFRDAATKDWSSTNKPKFPKFIKYINSPRYNMKFGVRVVAQNARGANISVYRMNNDNRSGGMATKVRYAFMGLDFQAKTKPRRFGLFGTGGEGKLGRHPLKGIKARSWDETANEILSNNQQDSELSRLIIKHYKIGMKNVQGKTRNG